VCFSEIIGAQLQNILLERGRHNDLLELLAVLATSEFQLHTLFDRKSSLIVIQNLDVFHVYKFFNINKVQTAPYNPKCDG
jgi:hypothetical protein